MDRMSDLDLERVIKGVAIFYRTTPKHKLRIVKVCALMKFFLFSASVYFLNHFNRSFCKCATCLLSAPEPI